MLIDFFLKSQNSLPFFTNSWKHILQLSNIESNKMILYANDRFIIEHIVLQFWNMGRRMRVFWLKIKALWLNLTKNRCVRLLLRLRPKITFVKKKKTWSSFRRIQNAAVSSDQFYEKLPILGSNSEWPKRLINLQIGYHEIELFLLFKLRPRLGTIQLIFKTMMNREVTKKINK